ncbi:Group XV phospholipase A2, partial [Stegodyphus mimosarum]
MNGYLSPITTISVVIVTLLSVLPSNVYLMPYQKNPYRRPSPVILIPGDGGSRLEAKLDKPKIVNILCDRKTSGYFNLWLNLELVLPDIIDCMVDNMRLVYNNETRTTSNSPGVDIRIPDFGNTSAVEWLDPTTAAAMISRLTYSTYFADIIDMLVREGYRRGVDVRGAPYDHRKAPNEYKKYFEDLRNLTEETYSINSQTKITFICHSMGCPVISYFLSMQTQLWKDKYVERIIALAGAFGGAVKAMKGFAAGDDLGIAIISSLKVRNHIRTCPSLAYMLPSSELWGENEALMVTPKKVYTVSDFHEFFQDINYTTGYEMYKDTHRYALRSLQPPGVEVHCLYGTNVPTVERVDYKSMKHFPDHPEVIYGNGDGTVNEKSMAACMLWQGKQKQKVHRIPLQG